MRSRFGSGTLSAVRAEFAYDAPGELTTIDAALLPYLAELPTAALDLCRIAQSLLISPEGAEALHLSDDRKAEKSIRSASGILSTLVTLDSSPLPAMRRLEHRVVGTCRHFSLLSCALLRHRGIAARARCGFATYFVPGKYVDHWIVECWDPTDARWARIDSEMLGIPVVPAPEDLAPGEFLTGGEAWVLCRDGGVDPALFGVHGVPHAWGIGEIRGNAIRDLAALNKLEMLPWDEWGRMEASYKGETGPDYDQLIGVVAATCASGGPSALRALFASEDVSVPLSMIR